MTFYMHEIKHKFLLPDNAKLFGRGPDLDHLHGRIQKRGLTIISGRPKMGKTWLVRKLCDDLVIKHDWLIGYSVSTTNLLHLVYPVILSKIIYIIFLIFSVFNNHIYTTQYKCFA